MGHYKHYNISKKRKDKFKNLTMPLKSGLLIIILGILVTNIKVSSAKKYDWKHTNKYEVFAFPQSRHSNHLKKYKDYSFFPSRHYKKPSRYPSLDEISNRLDNKIEIRLENLESTTPNPYDDWEFITPNATSLNEKYSYKIDHEPVTVKSGDKLRHSKYRLFKDDWNEFGDSGVELGSDKKGTLHFSTSKPWEYEQRDIAFHGLGSSKDTNNDLPSFSAVTVKSYNPAPFKEELLKKSHSHSRFSKKLSKEEILEKRREKNLERKESDEVGKNIEAVKQWQCQLPRAKIVRVQEVHTDPSKTYLPSCAILHRCSDDTGCCNDLKEVCKPKNITKIEIAFRVITHKNSLTKVERLAFENHTECSCQKKTDEIIPEQRDSESYFSQKFIRASTVDSTPVNKPNCKCPAEYSVRYLSNGTCACDCFDKQTFCISLKKGKNYFLPADQLCIQESLCLPPACEYGSYIKEYGRCPKSRERHTHFRRIIT